MDGMIARGMIARFRRRWNLLLHPAERPSGVSRLLRTVANWVANGLRKKEKKKKRKREKKRKRKQEIAK